MMKKVSTTHPRPRVERLLAPMMAILLFVSMATGFAFTATPERTDKSQLDLLSIKAVDVASTVSGIRAYTDLTDTKRNYQKSEVIYLAVTVEVKNLAKSGNSRLETIEGKNIEVAIGSTDIDFSLTKNSAPTVLSYIYSGDVESNIGTVATAMLGIGNVVKYDKGKNEISFVVTGTPLYQTGSLNALNIGATTDEKGRIVLPALKAKDGATKIQVGSTSYNMPYSAPEALQYTVLLTGVVREPSAKTGRFYAKMMLENAERFESYGQYYVKADGSVTESKPSGAEYVDYIEVEMEKLSIKNGYTIYRYFVPSSALYGVEVPIQYRGDDSNYTGEVLVRVNPNVFDKSAKTGESDVNVAGGVRGVQAHKTNQVSDKTSEVPISAIVYTSSASFFAPSFYAGIVKSEGAGAVVEAEVELTQGPVRQSRTATLAKQYTASVTYDRKYQGNDDNFDYRKDIEIDLHAKPKVSLSLDAAKEVWNKDTSADKPADFDPTRYPYIVMEGSGAAGGGENALGSYNIRRSSAENGEKTLVTVTINVNDKEETQLMAGETWTPTLKALNAADNGVGTVPREAEFALSQKQEKTMSWEENGLASKLLSFNDEKFSVVVRDKNGNELKADKDYKLVKASSNGKVTGIGIIPALDKEGNAPAWVSEVEKVKVGYFDPKAAGGAANTSDRVEKASDSLLKDVVGHNGIAAYIVTTYGDETPIVTLTSEDTYFRSDIGSGIGSFESGRRIYHASVRNFIYADEKAGNVKDSTRIGNVYSYFGLDTSFNSNYKLEEAIFEARGSNAAYSDSINGEFLTALSIKEDEVTEGTDEDELDMDEGEIDVPEEPDENEEPEEPEIDDTPEEPEETTPDKVEEIPATGDFGGKSGLALALSACVLVTGFFAITRRIRLDEGETD